LYFTPDFSLQNRFTFFIDKKTSTFNESWRIATVCSDFFESGLKVRPIPTPTQLILLLTNQQFNMHSSILLILSLVALTQATVVPLTSNDKCVTGSFQCFHETVRQCNHGAWVQIADCGAQDLVCFDGDYECIPPDSHFLTSLSLTRTTCPATTVTETEYETETETATITKHKETTETETVTEYETETETETVTEYKKHTVTETETETETGTCEPTPTDVTECVDNAFQCLGQKVQQCAFGKWITIATCASDQFCLDNDYECIPLSRWDEFHSYSYTYDTEE
jgi:hypothetical protein